jgi:hypothetical protein
MPNIFEAKRWKNTCAVDVGNGGARLRMTAYISRERFRPQKAFGGRLLVTECNLNLIGERNLSCIFVPVGFSNHWTVDRAYLTRRS